MTSLQRPFFSICALLFFLSTPAFATPAGDVNCDGEVDVVDVRLSILLALNFSINVQLDSDLDGVVDA